MLPPRLRRILPHALGLTLAVALLWQGSAELEHAASEAEAYGLRVDELNPIMDAGSDTWRARVVPIQDAARVQLRVDGQLIPAPPGLADGQIELTRDALLAASGLDGVDPGWHFVEAAIERRGGRREAITEGLLVGSFATIAPPTPAGPGQLPERCDVALSASERLLQALLVPQLEARVLPELQANAYMGPDTKITHARLELLDDAIRFELELSGENTLGVSGVIAAWVDGERKLQAKLVALGEVEFRGTLRTQARAVGAGGGAIVGGLIFGPLAPVGAFAGGWLADDFVSDKARSVVRSQIDAGLDELSGVELLPESLELLPGESGSRVRLGFCSRTRVRGDGLVAGLWVVPEQGEQRFELGVEGSLVTGTTPTFEALGGDEDLRVELSLDLLNAFLTEWTRSGLLLDKLELGASLERANAELDEWTPLQLSGLRPTRPPVLTPAGGPQQGFVFGLGGLEVELSGVEEQPWGKVLVTSEGTLQLDWQEESRTLKLSGSLDRLALTCVQASEDGAALLRPCFVSVLEAVEVRERIDERLRTDDRMPAIALGDLLAERLDLSLDSLSLERPHPGLLRLSAKVRPELVLPDPEPKP